MFHGRVYFGQRVISGVDLAIDFATLGEYGLSADGSCRQRTGRRSRPSRRPGWEASATTRRGACGTVKRTSGEAPDAGEPGAQPSGDWRFPRADAPSVDFRGAAQRYAA